MTATKRTAATDSTEQLMMHVVHAMTGMAEMEELKSMSYSRTMRRMSETDGNHNRGGTKIRVENLHYEVTDRDLEVRHSKDFQCRLQLKLTCTSGAL